MNSNEVILFVPICKKYMEENISVFLEILRNVPHEYWIEENFLMDLPGKWEYSIAALYDGRIIAYIIASIKDEITIRIHKFMVSQNFRSSGIGKRLLRHFEESLGNAFKYITLKLYKDNQGAHRFYQNNGFYTEKYSKELIEMQKYINL